MIRSKYCPACKSDNLGGRERSHNRFEIWCKEKDCGMVWYEMTWGKERE